MRLFTLTLVFLFLILGINAQTVFIPDPQFRAKLNAWAPGLVDVNGFMPVDNEALNPGTLELLVDWSPADLSGLGALQISSMTMIVEDDVQLTVFEAPDVWMLSIRGFPANASWPQMPPGLESFTLAQSQVTTFPELPESLWYLQLDTLPGLSGTITLPHYIQEISMHSLNISGIVASPVNEFVALEVGLQLKQLPLLGSFPHVASDSIYFIQMGDVGLTEFMVDGRTGSFEVYNAPVLETLHLTGGVGYSLVAGLPALHTVVCGPSISLELVELPSLASVTLTGSYENATISDAPSLVEFPTLILLPEDECQLSISHAAITNVGPLPEGLRRLLIEETPLSSIGTFPSSLTNLGLTNTELMELPELQEGLMYMGVSGSNIECLPQLPNSLINLSVDPDEINCIPNMPPGLDMFLWVPLCTILNSTCPELNPYIRGTVFYDINENGTQDDGEPGIPNASVVVHTSGYVAGTDAEGKYTIGVPAGDHTLSVQPLNYPIHSISPDTMFVSLPEIATVVDQGHFAVSIDEISYDLSVSAIWQTPVRPGFNCRMQFLIQNLGNAVTNVEVTLQYAEILTFLSSTVEPVSSAPGLTWILDELGFGEVQFITVHFNATVDAVLGSEVVMHLHAMDVLDLDPASNTYVLVDEVVGSYDPNDKKVTPSVLLPEQGLAGHRLEYLIRFQNTGTYLAERVLITDTLSTDLLPQTLQFLGSSHSCTWFYREGALHVLFEDIMLPDSTSNEPESHGFVLFRIHTRDQLLVGDQIPNIANIYFDFNEPVITDPAVLAVVLPTAIAATIMEEVQLYPVPTNGILNLRHDGFWAGAEVVITSITGAIASRGMITSALDAQLDLTGLSSGVYIISISKGGSLWTGRVVKE
jgi:hypothetical protein